jgi:hypothetical protein
MKLFLIAYVNAAIVAPVLWIGARLWLRRNSRTTAPGLVSAKIIAFPRPSVTSNRSALSGEFTTLDTRGPPHLQ